MREITLQSKIDEPIVLGLGFFDCVHLGHRSLIEKIKSKADELNCKSGIITFSNNPYKLFNYESKLIYTYDERLAVFKKLGLDYCLSFRFNTFFKEMPREEFLENLFKSFNIKGFVCGYDYLFGAKGGGDTNYLQKICNEKNISLQIIEPVLHGCERVSSTLVKECLENGEIEKADVLLADNYFMSGEVVRGRGIGHTYNIPTVNIGFSKDKMLIKNGVYLTTTIIDGIKKKSVTNIGTKPTFDEPQITVETFIENESRNLYGKVITIEFHKYIRDIKKFSSPQNLVQQIKKDLKTNI